MPICQIAHNWTGRHSHHTTNTDTFPCIRILRPITINRNNVVYDYVVWLAVGPLTCVITIVIQYEHNQNVIHGVENL